jgi:hypothetical protein
LNIKVIDGILNTVVAALAGGPVNRRGKPEPGSYCIAANAAGRIVNNNENTSAAADGNAAGRGAEGSNALNPFEKNGAPQLLQRSTKRRCDGWNKREQAVHPKRQGTAGPSSSKATDQTSAGSL